MIFFSFFFFFFFLFFFLYFDYIYALICKDDNSKTMNVDIIHVS